MWTLLFWLVKGIASRTSGRGACLSRSHYSRAPRKVFDNIALASFRVHYAFIVLRTRATLVLSEGREVWSIVAQLLPEVPLAVQRARLQRELVLLQGSPSVRLESGLALGLQWKGLVLRGG